ncbi:hypothetical protein BVRB_1g010230 [Beta vulgaris subsp. vulgaris]|nr:hypothetical protein BVRB_1g010230 [Beta vulgaris subsp. vulgaris]
MRVLSSTIHVIIAPKNIQVITALFSCAEYTTIH